MSESFPDFDKECFLIAPIGEENSEIRKRSDQVFTHIVKKAMEQFDFETIRADKISTPGAIDLQVIKHLLKARVAIADVTNLNPNVFYEMGIRHTAQLPLILIAEIGTLLPFDLLQARTIFFDHTDLDSAEECKVNIVKQIEAALNGQDVNSPVTMVGFVNSMSSGNPLERIVAELVQNVEELSQSQNKLFASINTDRSTRVNTVIQRALVDLDSAVNELSKDLSSDNPPVLAVANSAISRAIRVLAVELGSSNQNVGYIRLNDLAGLGSVTVSGLRGVTGGSLVLTGGGNSGGAGVTGGGNSGGAGTTGGAGASA